MLLATACHVVAAVSLLDGSAALGATAHVVVLPPLGESDLSRILAGFVLITTQPLVVFHPAHGADAGIAERAGDHALAAQRIHLGAVGCDAVLQLVRVAAHVVQEGSTIHAVCLRRGQG